MTQNKLYGQMIKDKETIRKAIEEIIGGESFIRLRTEDFAEVCPNPAWAVHATGKDTDDLLGQLVQELGQADGGKLYGTVAYIRTSFTSSLTMSDLARIDAMLPCAPRRRKGIAFIPDVAGTEIWFIADEGLKKEDI